MVSLRNYQSDALSAIESHFRRSPAPAAVVIPTGGGKTVLFAELARRYAPQRVVVLVHRDELALQACAKLSEACGEPVGRVQGASNQTWNRLTVASVQTLSRPDRLPLVPPPGLLIVDEAHHSVAASYQTVLSEWPEADVLGVTATMARGSATGDAKLNRVWPNLVYSIGVKKGVDEGWLAPFHIESVALEALHLERVKRVAGDYSEKSLGEAFTQARAPEGIAEAICEKAISSQGGIRRTIAFLPTIETARAVRDELAARNVRAKTIIGSTPVVDRQETYRELASGQIDVITSVMVLTEGFDLPEVEVVVVARPTKLPHLWMQMAGRGLRPCPWSGKTSALILDVGGTAECLKEELLEKFDLRVCETMDRQAAGNDRHGPGPATHSAPQILLSGVTSHREIRSDGITWSVTSDGVLFLPLGKSMVVFLTGKSGRVRPLAVPLAGWGLRGAKAGGAPTSIEQAVEEARGLALEEYALTATTERAWRKKKISDAQVSYLAGLGVKEGVKGLRAGEASDLISQIRAERRLATLSPSAINSLWKVG